MASIDKEKTVVGKGTTRQEEKKERKEAFEAAAGSREGKKQFGSRLPK